MPLMHLVLIETSGNQRYIFDTNKLRENVGASELTLRAGTDWVTEAVAAMGDQGIEVMVATSGKALLLVKDKETGRAIVGAVTAKALECAPGLDISGVVGEAFEWDDLNSLDKANAAVHAQFEQARTALPGPDMRFLRLPVVVPCATSGLPAAEHQKFGKEREGDYSVVSLNKRGSTVDALNRMGGILQRKDPNSEQWKSFSGSLDGLAKLDTLEEREWLAVVHADGNGLGEIFLAFATQAGTEGNHDYVTKYREFSKALDGCTERAFLKALDAFVSEDASEIVPLVPLVLGGDDMTVVCDGKRALPFTQKFLAAFEEETREDGVVGPIAKQALNDNRLSACAGVAVVKPHFPFSVAYSLAEELLHSAKSVKERVTKNGKAWPCSALDFHILYDTSGVSLSSIRAHLVKDGGVTHLHGGPYVVTPATDLAGADAGADWAKRHHWDGLVHRVAVLHKKDENGRRVLPNSQVHDLRAGLAEGRTVAEARYELIRHRYTALKELGGENGKLFWDDPETGEAVTGLLDAVEAQEFLKEAG